MPNQDHFSPFIATVYGKDYYRLHAPDLKFHSIRKQNKIKLPYEIGKDIFPPNFPNIYTWIFFPHIIHPQWKMTDLICN